MMLHDDFEGAVGAELGPGWQPIETAPKDGTPVLLWLGSRFIEARWEAGSVSV